MILFYSLVLIQVNFIIDMSVVFERALCKITNFIIYHKWNSDTKQVTYQTYSGEKQRKKERKKKSLSLKWPKTMLLVSDENCCVLISKRKYFVYCSIYESETCCTD